MSQVKQFCKQQELNIDQNSAQQTFSLKSLSDSIQSQNGLFEKENENMLNLFMEQLKGLINRLTDHQATQLDKMNSCLSHLDDLCGQFNEFHKGQTQTTTRLMEHLDKQEQEFEEISKISKSNVLMQIDNQAEFNRKQVKILSNDFSKVFDEMKEKLLRKLEESCSLQDENLKNTGNAVIEDFDKQRVKNREIIEGALDKLTDMNEVAENYPSQAKEASEKLKNYLGNELQTSNNEYCHDMRAKIDLMQTDLSAKLGEMEDRMQQHTDTIAQGISVQKAQIDDAKQIHIAEHQAFMANISVSAEDVESRFNDISEQYIADTSEKLFARFDALEVNNDEVISSIFEISQNSCETVEKLEYNKDVPTGTTPLKKDFNYKRNLQRPRPQSLLLEKFAPSNSNDEEEKTDEDET